MENVISCNSVTQQQPYQKYETGNAPFFDRSSSSGKGRFRVRDAKGFAPESMRRRPDPNGNQSNDVMLLVGKKIDGENEEELTITIMFDRSKYDESTASQWWALNRHRFIDS